MRNLKKYFVFILLTGCIDKGQEIPRVETSKISEPCLQLSGTYKFSMDACEWSKEHGGDGYAPFKLFKYIGSINEGSSSTNYDVKNTGEITIKQNGCRSLTLSFPLAHLQEDKVINVDLDLEKIAKNEKLILDEKALTLNKNKSGFGCQIGCGYEDNVWYMKMQKTDQGNIEFMSGHREYGVAFFVAPFRSYHTIKCLLAKQ